MLVVRFLLILSAIAVAVSFGVYILTRDKRYLRFAWQLFKFCGMLLLVVAAVIAMGRIILF
jgi:hypothetical protein